MNKIVPKVAWQLVIIVITRIPSDSDPYLIEIESESNSWNSTWYQSICLNYITPSRRIWLIHVIHGRSSWRDIANYSNSHTMTPPRWPRNIWNPVTHNLWLILLYTYIYNIVKSFDICFFRFNNFLKHFRSHFWSFSAQFCSLTFLMLQNYSNATFLNVSQPLKCSKIV